MNDEPELLKNKINKHAIQRLSHALKSVVPAFDQRKFEKIACQNLNQLELKARVAHIIEALRQVLPSDFRTASEWICLAADAWPNPNQSEEQTADFAAWPMIDYVGIYGIEQPTTALTTLKHITYLFSAEFAIRPFFSRHFELTYQTVLTWLNDDNEHVRRLASEGIRPRLPWGKQLEALKQDPSPIIPLLTTLNNDPSKYVQKSVANNLNDISKDHPKQAIRIATKWLKDPTPTRQWIVKHGLRTLIKQGSKSALLLLGFKPASVVCSDFCLNANKIKEGDTISWTATIESKKKRKQPLVIDYAIHFVKANGKTLPKVFKGKTIELESLGSYTLSKKHSFKKISTRTYYAGEHRLELLINGQSIVSQTFF